LYIYLKVTFFIHNKKFHKIFIAIFRTWDPPHRFAPPDPWLREGAGAMDAVPEGAPANRGLLSLLKAMRA